MPKTTLRSSRKKEFTQINNSMLWDKEITLQAKGLLSILVSNTDNWNTNMTEIFSRSKNGRDAQYKLIDELIKFGYFARVEIREGGKFVELIYLFSDNKNEVAEDLEEFKDNPSASINPDKKKPNKSKISPLPENQDTVVKTDDSPFPESSDTVSSDSVNQDINNTKGNNTNLNNTKSSKSISPNIDTELNSIEYSQLPLPVQKVISLNKKRLTDDNISVMDIYTFYRSSDNTVPPDDFPYILNNVLTKTKGSIKSFNHLMKKTIKNHYDEYTAELMPNIGNTYDEVASTSTFDPTKVNPFSTLFND